MNFRYRHQPLKSFYLVYRLGVLTLRFPVWIARALVPPWRPRPTWGLRKVIQNSFLTFFVETIFQVGLPALDTSPSATSMLDGFVAVEPVPTSLLVGDIESMALVNGVKTERVWGYWYGIDPSRVKNISSDEKVFYFLHAGGFAMGSASPNDMFTPVLSKGLLSLQKGYVFALEYRLASGTPFPSSNPYPAALIDVLAGYHYLLSVGIEPRNIIICGESAGCVLALSLTRYLIMHRFPSVPPPGAVLLTSPSADWGLPSTQGSMKHNSGSDYSALFFQAGYCTQAALGKIPLSQAITNPWISPASADLEASVGLFTGFPKTCIVAGEAECGIDSIRILRDRLEGDLGKEGEVTYLEIFGGTHCFCSMEAFEPERSEALRGIDAWMSLL